MQRLIDTNLTRGVLLFATEVYAGQERIKGGVPYIIHPYAVASLVTLHYELFKEVFVEAYATALLHDAIEDTPTTYDDIAAKTNSALVADAVRALTKDESAGDDRAQLIDSLNRAKEVGDWVVWIKAFDRIDNWNFALCPPTRTDEEFQKLLTEGDDIIAALEGTARGEAIRKLFIETRDRYRRFAGL